MILSVSRLDAGRDVRDEADRIDRGLSPSSSSVPQQDNETGGRSRGRVLVAAAALVVLGGIGLVLVADRRDEDGPAALDIASTVVTNSSSISDGQPVGSAVTSAGPAPTSSVAVPNGGALDRAAELVRDAEVLPGPYELLGGLEVPGTDGIDGAVVALRLDEPFSGTLVVPNLTGAIDTNSGASIEILQEVEYVLEGATQFVVFVDFGPDQIRSVQSFEGDLSSYVDGSAGGPTDDNYQAVVTRTVINERRLDGSTEPFEREEGQ